MAFLGQMCSWVQSLGLGLCGLETFKEHYFFPIFGSKITVWPQTSSCSLSFGERNSAYSSDLVPRSYRPIYSGNVRSDVLNFKRCWKECVQPTYQHASSVAPKSIPISNVCYCHKYLYLCSSFPKIQSPGLQEGIMWGDAAGSKLKSWAVAWKTKNKGRHSCRFSERKVFTLSWSELVYPPKRKARPPVLKKKHRQLYFCTLA